MLAEAADRVLLRGQAGRRCWRPPSGHTPRCRTVPPDGPLHGGDRARDGARAGWRRRGRRGSDPRAVELAERLARAGPGPPDASVADDRPDLPARDRVGRPLLAQALRTARARAAVGVAPVRAQPARPRPGDDRQLGGRRGHYEEAIGLARESDQRTDLGFGLAGLAWLQARRGRDGETRALAAEAIEVSARARGAAVRGVGDGRAWRARARPRRGRPRGRALRATSGGCCASSGSPTSICPRRPSWSTRT